MGHSVPEILPEYKEDKNPPSHERTAFKAPTQTTAFSLQTFQALLPITKGKAGTIGVMFLCSFNLLSWDCLNPFGLMLELYFLAPVYII